MKHMLTLMLVAIAIALPHLAQAQAQERFPELRLDQLTPEQKQWVDTVAGPPRGANFRLPPYRIYMRSPELATRFTAMSDYLRWNTAMPARMTEFAILITARHWSSHWIWRGHYKGAMKGGLAPAVAADLAVGKRPAGMQEDEAVLYDLATQIYRDKSVSDATYDAALAKFGERGIVELIALMGYYDTVAMMLLTAKAMPPADDTVPQLAVLAK